MMVQGASNVAWLGNRLVWSWCICFWYGVLFLFVSSVMLFGSKESMGSSKESKESEYSDDGALDIDCDDEDPQCTMLRAKEQFGTLSLLVFRLTLT